MSDLTLTATHLSGGVWHGVLTVSNAVMNYHPQLGASHLGVLIDGVLVTQSPDQDLWQISVPVPPEAISDGVHTILITDQRTGMQLGSFAILAGEALSDDIRAELDLLRAELDLLKKAFRRHCSESSI